MGDRRAFEWYAEEKPHLNRNRWNASQLEAVAVFVHATNARDCHTKIASPSNSIHSVRR